MKKTAVLRASAVYTALKHFSPECVPSEVNEEDYDEINKDVLFTKTRLRLNFLTNMSIAYAQIFENAVNAVDHYFGRIPYDRVPKKDFFVYFFIRDYFLTKKYRKIITVIKSKLTKETKTSESDESEDGFDTNLGLFGIPVADCANYIAILALVGKGLMEYDQAIVWVHISAQVEAFTDEQNYENKNTRELN